MIKQTFLLGIWESMLIRAVKHRRVTASFIAVYGASRNLAETTDCAAANMYFRCPRLQNTALTQEDGYVRTESWQCLDPLAPSSTATLSWGFTNNHVYMEGQNIMLFVEDPMRGSIYC